MKCYGSSNPQQLKLLNSHPYSDTHTFKSPHPRKAHLHTTKEPTDLMNSGLLRCIAAGFISLTKLEQSAFHGLFLHTSVPPPPLCGVCHLADPPHGSADWLDPLGPTVWFGSNQRCHPTEGLAGLAGRVGTPRIVGVRGLAADGSFACMLRIATEHVGGCIAETAALIHFQRRVHLTHCEIALRGDLQGNTCIQPCSMNMNVQHRQFEFVQNSPNHNCQMLGQERPKWSHSQTLRTVCGFFSVKCLHYLELNCYSIPFQFET